MCFIKSFFFQRDKVQQLEKMINRRIELESTVARQDMLNDKILKQEVQINQTTETNALLRGLLFNSSLQIEMLRLQIENSEKNKQVQLAEITKLNANLHNASIYTKDLEIAFGGLAEDLAASEKTLSTCVKKIHRRIKEREACKNESISFTLAQATAKKENLGLLKECNGTVDDLKFSIKSFLINGEDRQTLWKSVMDLYNEESYKEIEAALALKSTSPSSG